VIWKHSRQRPRNPWPFSRVALPPVDLPLEALLLGVFLFPEFHPQLVPPPFFLMVAFALLARELARSSFHPWEYYPPFFRRGTALCAFVLPRSVSARWLKKAWQDLPGQSKNLRRAKLVRAYRRDRGGRVQCGVCRTRGPSNGARRAA
jgi:hypothetical protein